MKIINLVIIPQIFCTVVYADNSIRITETENSNKINYPVVIGRPFARGEIPNYPVAAYNGSVITTQANVKKRWEDGSVRHAIISFLIDLSAGQSKDILFLNQNSVDTQSLSKDDILGPLYNLETKVIANFDSDSAIISAREMISNDKYSTFTPGAVANTIVVADHSSSRSFDFGSDTYKSLRPVFNITFFPELKNAFIRVIVENSSTEVLQDQKYSILISKGFPASSTVYSKPVFNHHAGSRWTKTFWLNGDPGKINIDHNPEYLSRIGAIYTYQAMDLTENIINTTYQQWISSSKDIYDQGNLNKASGTAGLRGEIGPYPRWNTLWILSGDSRMQEVALGNADLAAAWPIHFREGDGTKHLDRHGTISGLGKMLSISNRPTISLRTGYNYSYTATKDRIKTVGATTNNGWVPDVAHIGDYYSTAYLLTGDHWYLEQGLFANSWITASSNGAATSYSYGRGPTGAEGGLSGELRAKAWTMRNRVNMAAVIPDEMPELDLLETWISDSIKIEEGRLNINIDSGNSLWLWGRNVQAGGLHQPPLHQYATGSKEFVQVDYGINKSKVSAAISQFEQNYMMIALGRAKQLGYGVENIFSYLSKYYTEAQASSYNYHLLANGRLPTQDETGEFFKSYDDLASGYDCSSSAVHCSEFAYDIGYYWGYPYVLRSALSYIAEVDNHGLSLYNTVNNDLTKRVGGAIAINPQWGLAKPN